MKGKHPNFEPLSPHMPPPKDLEQVGVKEKRVGAAGRLLLNAALGEADGHVASGKVHEGQGLREGPYATEVI